MEIIFWLGFCALVAYFADKKGRNAVGWGALAFVISPLFAGIALAIAKDLTVEKSIQDINNRTDNLKMEMDYNQKYNELRSDNIEKNVNRIASGQDSTKSLDNSKEETRYLSSNSGGKSSQSIADELSKLHELKQAGVLTEEEFTMQKKRILSQ